MSTSAGTDSKVIMICPNLACRRTLRAPAAARGKTMRCPFCNSAFRVPAATQQDTEPSAQSGNRQ